MATLRKKNVCVPVFPSDDVQLPLRAQTERGAAPRRRVERHVPRQGQRRRRTPRRPLESAPAEGLEVEAEDGRRRRVVGLHQEEELVTEDEAGRAAKVDAEVGEAEAGHA